MGDDGGGVERVVGAGDDADGEAVGASLVGVGASTAAM